MNFSTSIQILNNPEEIRLMKTTTKFEIFSLKRIKHYTRKK